MNQHTMETLQIEELKEIVQQYCVSSLGKQRLAQLSPSSNIKVVKIRLQETSEARWILDRQGHVPLVGISHIGHMIDQLEKGDMLEPAEFVAVADFLRGCRKVKQFMEQQQEVAPLLSSYSQSMAIFQQLEEEIHAVVDGNRVRSEATRELKRIRKAIIATEEKIEQRLQRFLNQPSNKQWLQEYYITKKHGRFTVPVKASYKNKIAGTIIETSAKGATVFVEPEAIEKLSMELLVLQTDEEIQVYQILAALAGLVLEQVSAIKINVDLIAQYDMIFAKGKYSKANNAMAPQINQHGYVHISKGRHPLLKGDIVPLDVTLGATHRSLIITGPNAGGKTLVLKTIGILTIATEMGLHIGAQQGTNIAIFERIFVDIGDNQSLDNALSTFSAHMKNISHILKQANKHTLLLLDEIGSGTEPKEGAALAIALLEGFYHKGCITVATTHYGEIKDFSQQHEDFINGAMEFDAQTLAPQYRLLIGHSGQSNALWIAKRMDIDRALLRRAEEYMQGLPYHMERISPQKIAQPIVEVVETQDYQYQVGDRVIVSESQQWVLVYEQEDCYHQLKVFDKGNIMEVHRNRLTLEQPASVLYPEGYDLQQLFVDYGSRKWEHDVQRGSKKALRQITKEMRQQKQQQ